GREVGVDDERERADAAEIVDDRGDRVERNIGEAVHAKLLHRLTGDDRLGPEPLDDEREAPPTQFEYERRLAARLVDRLAVRLDETRGGQGGGQRAPLARVEGGVVDARPVVSVGRGHGRAEASVSPVVRGRERRVGRDQPWPRRRLMKKIASNTTTNTPAPRRTEGLRERCAPR